MGILIYFLFPAFIFTEVARIQLTPTIGATALDIVVICSALLYLLTCAWRKLPIFPEKIKTPLLLVVVAMAGSLLINSYQLTADQLLVSFLYCIRFAAYSILLSTVIQASSAVKKKVIIGMLISGSAILFIGYLQYFFYQSLRNLYYLGWDDHYLRLFSSFLDPNFAGVFLVLFLLFLSIFISKAYKEGKKYFLCFTIVLSFLSFLGVLLTYSRTSYIMLVVGVVSLLLIKKRKLFAGVAVLVIFLGVMLTADVRIEGLNPFRTASTNARIQSMHNALTIIEDNPIFGVGFNAYRYAQIRHNFRIDSPPFPSHADAGTDNSYLFITATTGVIGLLAYLYFLFTLGKNAFQKRKQSDQAAIFFVSLLAWGIGSLFINGLFYPPLLFWMWMLFGTIEE